MTKPMKVLAAVALLGMVVGAMLFIAGVRRAEVERRALFARPQEVPSVRAAEIETPPEWAAAVERARPRVQAAMVEQNLPGMSVAVGAGGRLVWAEGFGWRDVETRTPVTPETRFHIGTAASAVSAALASGAAKAPESKAPQSNGLELKHTGTDEAAEWSPEHVGEPEEDPPPFRIIRQAIFEPLGLADPPKPLPGERTRFYVPRGAEKDPRQGREPMKMRELACCAAGKTFYSTPSDLARWAMATKAESVNGELAGGTVMSVVVRPGIIVVVTANVAGAKTEALAEKVAEAFGK